MAPISLLGTLKRKARGTLSRGPETKFDLLGYLTLIKMMAKVYSAIDSISTSAKMSMF